MECFNNNVSKYSSSIKLQYVFSTWCILGKNVLEKSWVAYFTDIISVLFIKYVQIDTYKVFPI